MTVLMWGGAAVLLLCSVACGLNLGGRVAKGVEKAWAPQILSWAIGFHGVAGVAALLLVMRAVKG